MAKHTRRGKKKEGHTRSNFITWERPGKHSETLVMLLLFLFLLFGLFFSPCFKFGSLKKKLLFFKKRKSKRLFWRTGIKTTRTLFLCYAWTSMIFMNFTYKKTFQFKILKTCTTVECIENNLRTIEKKIKNMGKSGNIKQTTKKGEGYIPRTLVLKDRME